MGAFLDADFEALTSVLSITVDYLAGLLPHVDRRPCCVFIAVAWGLASLACLTCLSRVGVSAVTLSTACRTMLVKVPPSCCPSPAGSGGSSWNGSSTRRKATTLTGATEALTASTV